MCIESTLRVYRNDFDLSRNNLYRNDFVSKRPDTFQMAPLVHAGLSTCDDGFAANPIVVVISPLLSLMEDQTNFLLAQGISAGSIGENKAGNAKIENGECCVVFTSPESLLGNGRWRSTCMLSSDIYKKNLIGIVVVKHTVLAIGECYFCC